MSDIGLDPADPSRDVEPDEDGDQHCEHSVVAQLDRAGHQVVDVVGVSLGALVAITLAAQHPHRIGSVVVADCTPKYPDAMVMMWTERAAAVDSDGVGAFVGATMALWFNEGFLDEHPEFSYLRGILERTESHGYADACRALAAADIRDDAAALTQRTLVMCGTNDAPPFRDGAEWLGRSIPGAVVEWVDGGRHACFVENAADVAEVLRGFLSSPR